MHNLHKIIDLVMEIIDIYTERYSDSKPKTNPTRIDEWGLSLVLDKNFCINPYRLPKNLLKKPFLNFSDSSISIDDSITSSVNCF